VVYDVGKLGLCRESRLGVIKNCSHDSRSPLGFLRAGQGSLVGLAKQELDLK